MTDTFKIDGTDRRISLEFDTAGATTTGSVEIALTAEPVHPEMLQVALEHPGRVVRQRTDGSIEVIPPEYDIVRGWPDGRKETDE